jgi:IclR family acetate operon transcriptional repressor
VPRAGSAAEGHLRSSTVSSVDNALTLLAAMRDHPSLAVKEGAQLLGVAPSTAHRLLSTLLAHGFVVQDPATRRYRPGPRLLEVALSSLERVDVRRVARPHLVALAAEVRETASLVVLEGTQVRFIDSAEGPELVRVANRTGDVLPAHLTSGGKAILAALPRAELQRLFPDEVITAAPDRAGSSRTALFDELVQVRADGFATSFERTAAGLSAVAVTIGDLHGNPLAAIGVSVPTVRLDDRRVREIAGVAGRRARRIEEELHALARSQSVTT